MGRELFDKKDNPLNRKEREKGESYYEKSMEKNN